LLWKCCKFGSKLLRMRTLAVTHADRSRIFLCALFCLLAMLPLGHAQSITELKSRAEDGNVQAQLALAKAYDLGEGVPKDVEKAVQWWEKAAEHGNVSAQVSLGEVYSLGAGVPKNYAAAVRWWKKAAEQGDVTAEGNLGTAYGLGMGVPKDTAESVRWHTKAAENGNAASQFSLGMFYLQGAGVPKDEAEGVKWLRKSADQGNAAGQFWLGASYYSGTGVAKDTAEALRWYRKAGNQGYAAAQYNLGQAYNLGNGVEKDPAEAARWWQKAAEQGMAKAQYNLGMAYRAGAGVEKDNLQAYFWIAIAASSLEQGFVKDYRDKVEAVLTPAQLADVQERIRKFEEAHPATQTASLNSLPSVPQDQHQAQPQAQPSVHLVALGIRPVFIAFPKPATCDGKLASVLLSSFKEALSASQRHELIRDLSDNGKMDTVLIVQMSCEERNNSVSVTSTYGEAKCFGPKNCHAALDPRTGNVLSCDPNGEPICGKELFKEFEYVLATTGIDVRLE
jgi:TPR repeat protein